MSCVDEGETRVSDMYVWVMSDMSTHWKGMCVEPFCCVCVSILSFYCVCVSVLSWCVCVSVFSFWCVCVSFLLLWVKRIKLKWPGLHFDLPSHLVILLLQILPVRKLSLKKFYCMYLRTILQLGSGYVVWVYCSWCTVLCKWHWYAYNYVQKCLNIRHVKQNINYYA